MKKSNAYVLSALLLVLSFDVKANFFTRWFIHAPVTLIGYVLSYIKPVSRTDLVRTRTELKQCVDDNTRRLNQKIELNFVNDNFRLTQLEVQGKNLTNDLAITRYKNKKFHEDQFNALAAFRKTMVEANQYHKDKLAKEIDEVKKFKMKMEEQHRSFIQEKENQKVENEKQHKLITQSLSSQQTKINELSEKQTEECKRKEQFISHLNNLRRQTLNMEIKLAFINRQTNEVTKGLRDLLEDSSHSKPNAEQQSMSANDSLAKKFMELDDNFKKFRNDAVPFHKKIASQYGF